MGSVSGVEVQPCSITFVYPITRGRSLGIMGERLQPYPSILVEEPGALLEFCGLLQRMKE